MCQGAGSGWDLMSVEGEENGAFAPETKSRQPRASRVPTSGGSQPLFLPSSSSIHGIHGMPGGMKGLLQPQLHVSLHLSSAKVFLSMRIAALLPRNSALTAHVPSLPHLVRPHQAGMLGHFGKGDTLHSPSPWEKSQSSKFGQALPL